MTDMNGFNNGNVNGASNPEPMYSEPVYSQPTPQQSNDGWQTAGQGTQMNMDGQNNFGGQQNFTPNNFGGQQNFNSNNFGTTQTFTPNYGAPQPEQKGFSIASLILGICAFSGVCIACCGYVLSIPGLVLGIIGMKKGAKGMAIAGIVLSCIALLLSIANSVLGIMINQGIIATPWKEILESSM